MYYAHIDDKERIFLLPGTYAGVYGFNCLTDAQRAEYGVYPFIKEDLLPGAAGWGAAYLDEQSQTIVKPSLPADPEKALANAKLQAHSTRYWKMLEARNGGFLFNGLRFESDTESRNLINGAALLATIAMSQGTQGALNQFSATLGTGWRTADGVPTITTAEGMIGLGMALAARVAYCDAVSQGHKATIDAAETVEAVQAVDVSAGYELEAP